MKKLLVCAAVLAIASFATPAQAQTCLDFDGFCDGLEVDVLGGGDLGGFWRNTDCAGTDVPISGRVSSGAVPNACAGGNGNAGLTGNVSGADWVFALDSLDGTMDMNMNLPPDTCWIEELAYTVISGACPFDIILQDGFSTTQ